MKPTVKGFKDELIEEIKNDLKTDYEKNELILRINEIYIKFLECYID